MTNENRCPRCGTEHLRTWSELTEEEQEVVRRLPKAAEYSPREREATHRWCKRCWFETTENSTHA